jgi:hypothetical protein
MGVTIKIGDIQRTMGNLRELDKRTVQKLAQFTFDESQKGAGRHNKTGALFQSLYNRSLPNGRAVGHDPQRANHAQYVLLGSRPHKILPKNRKALRWAKGGKFFFAKGVNHPGYRGDPYLFMAGDAALRNFAAFVDAAFKESTS